MQGVTLEYSLYNSHFNCFDMPFCVVQPHLSLQFFYQSLNELPYFWTYLVYLHDSDYPGVRQAVKFFLLTDPCHT